MEPAHDYIEPTDFYFYTRFLFFFVCIYNPHPPDTVIAKIQTIKTHVNYLNNRNILFIVAIR